MPRVALLRCLFVFLCFSPGHAADVTGLSWMTGCWAFQSGPVTIEEQWNKPVGGQMMGLSRTIKQDQVRLEQRAADVYYTPRLGTKASPVAFKLIQQTPSEVVFENPQHDFPQRILYRKAPDGLFARIEGTDKGKARSEDFPFRTVPCR
jgi:hypothetical protein